jgi:aconitase A
VFAGDDAWQGVETSGGLTYTWPAASTYVQNPPYFEGMGKEAGTIDNVDKARILAVLADSITTDHISPAGSFTSETPAGHLSHRTPGAGARVQLLRRTPRQPPGDDARHLRQHPHQEPDGAGC